MDMLHISVHFLTCLQYLDANLGHGRLYDYTQWLRTWLYDLYTVFENMAVWLIHSNSGHVCMTYTQCALHAHPCQDRAELYRAVQCNTVQCYTVHYILDSFFQCCSHIIDRVYQHFPSIHFRRAYTDSRGPIQIQEGQYGTVYRF